MKFLKISLAASLALGALSTASFAQPLEEAIKGVDVSGYLRYRYTDDRYDNTGFVRDSVSSSSAKHQWRAEADFKTPTINNVSLNLGILYRNDNQNVNHGKNGPDVVENNVIKVINGTGNALGAGQDSDFGVSQFYMTIAPDSTATTVMLGKQKLGTPVTNPGDGDRGTGILALNSDIPGLTLAAGAFDSWAIDDLSVTTFGSEGSVDKPLYTLAAIYGVDTSIGNIGAQVWFFNVTDMVDAMIYSELSWKH
ncbi:major outer membrane protein, partial [Helicobacter sp.]|uniref:major outer membrane protein n=1 Tax=Helicobacter sp. TaxID=218 RepID=UPI002A915C4E